LKNGQKVVQVSPKIRRNQLLANLILI